MGYLAVEVTGTPSPIDQLIIGHANSLLVPGVRTPRPGAARTGTGARGGTGTALTGSTGTAAAIGLLRTATDDAGPHPDAHGARRPRLRRPCVRPSTINSPPARATSSSAPRARRSLIPLRGTDDLALASSLFDTRRRRRPPTPADRAERAACSSRGAHRRGRVADGGGLALGAPVDATNITGRTLAVPETRNVLTAMACCWSSRSNATTPHTTADCWTRCGPTRGQRPVEPAAAVLSAPAHAAQPDREGG